MTFFGSYLDEIKKISLAVTPWTHASSGAQNELEEMHINPGRNLPGYRVCLNHLLKPGMFGKWVHNLLTDAIALRSDKSVQLALKCQ